MEDLAFADDLFGAPIAVANLPPLWGVWFQANSAKGWWFTDNAGRKVLSYDKRACLTYLDGNRFSVREVGDDGRPKNELDPLLCDEDYDFLSPSGVGPPERPRGIQPAP